MTSLAERLGYSPDAKLLIINCDDLGSSRSANVAVYSALRHGLATSATLMVPCPWALDGAAQVAAQGGAAGGIGVHLTLTCEYPGYRWRSLTGAASLHDAQGYLPATIREVWAQADLDQVRAECRAQIDQAYAWGVDITHLDGHMGAMTLEPRFFAVFLEMAEAYDLPVRMTSVRQEPDLGFPARALAAERGRLYADHTATTWASPARPTFERILARLRPGVTEVFVHPVEDGPELRGYDLKEPDIRVDDHALLTDPELPGLIAAAGATLISFAPLRDLMRAA